MDDGKLQTARRLEREGRLPAALKAYLEAGAAEDAARLLAEAARSGDAGRLLSGSLVPAAVVNRQSDSVAQRTRVSVIREPASPAASHVAPPSVVFSTLPCPPTA